MATTITPTGQHNDQRRDAAGPRRRSGGAASPIRRGRVADPAGHHWLIGKPLR